MTRNAPKIRNSGLGDAESARLEHPLVTINGVDLSDHVTEMRVRLEPGTSIRVKGRSGVWVVVRDSGGALVIIRSGREHTSTPREHVRPARKPKRETAQ